MKVVGIIKSVMLDRSGNTREGKPFESHLVEFEGGGDTHLVEVFITLGGTMSAQEILNRRGLVRDGIGEMDMQYTVREYNGKKFRQCSYVGFRIPQQPNRGDAQVGTHEPSQQEVAAAFAEMAEVAEAQAPGADGQPF